MKKLYYGFVTLLMKRVQRGDHESSKRYLVTARKYYPQDESLQAELLNWKINSLFAIYHLP
jgi:hypothetical protein